MATYGRLLWFLFQFDLGTQSSPQKIQAESDQEFKRTAQEDYEYMKREAPEVHTNLVQNLLRNKNMGQGSQGEREFQQRFREAGDDPAKVQSLFQEYFGQDVVTIDNGVYRPMVETRTLSELVGGGGGSSVYIPAYFLCGFLQNLHLLLRDSVKKIPE